MVASGLEVLPTTTSELKLAHELDHEEYADLLNQGVKFVDLPNNMYYIRLTSGDKHLYGVVDFGDLNYDE